MTTMLNLTCWSSNLRGLDQTRDRELKFRDGSTQSASHGSSLMRTGEARVSLPKDFLGLSV